MTIEARFLSSDIAGKLRDGPYDLPEGATVGTLMETAGSEANIELTEDQKNSYVFVLDNTPAFNDTKLHDGGMLRVMFKILGG